MKRFISVVLVIVMLFSVSIAYATDYSTISDEELNTLFYSIRNELEYRRLKTEKKVFILNQEGIQVYIDGPLTISDFVLGGLSLVVPVAIINNCEKSITVGPTHTSVNGWMTQSWLHNSVVNPGKKIKGRLEIDLNDTDVEALEDFESLEICFIVYDNDNFSGDKVIDKSSEVIVFASQINN